MKLLKLSMVVFTLIYFSSAESGVHKKSNSAEKEKRDKNQDPFVPTDEWQVVDKNIPLPAGLHIRVNMETGKTEAKLMETSKPASSVAVVSSVSEDDDEKMKSEKLNLDLKERLVNIPGDEVTAASEDINKFRTYEELKKDFSDLKMAMKTDLELMNDLFEKYKLLMEKQKLTSSDVEENVLAVLMDLEYLVHQVDNANEFSKSGGFQHIVFPALNSTSTKIRSEAARLLGSAVQNNIKVQISALESGTVGVLLRMLALDSTPEVRSSVFYALSCLVRKFPAAQKVFVDEGGVTVLSSLFNGDSSDQLKLQVKVVTFINDLMVERQDAEYILTVAVNSSLTTNNTAKDILVKEAEERIRQYQIVNLETKLQEQHWCQNLRDLLLKEVPHGISMSGPAFQPDHDVVEKVSGAMLSHIKTCSDYFKSDRSVVTILNDLIKYYKNLSLYEEDGPDESDEYFTDLSKQLETLSSKLYMLLNIKDEL